MYPMKVSYFYCSLEIDMMFLDTTRFKIYKEPRYELNKDGIIYHMYGFYVDNRIKKIIPKDRKNLLLMYKYYTNKGYTVPKWLDELVLIRKKSK